jgi:DNA-binding transcriptional LysR family regulator
MIEFRHIRYFVAVAEELHFGRAARRLHIAQPPLSQQIQRLEQELEVSLFDRTRRSVTLTPAGQIFLKQVTPIIEELSRAIDLVRLAGAGPTEVLKIGFVSSAPYMIFPAVLREFRRNHPFVRLELIHQSIATQIEALQRGSIDIGVLRAPIAQLDIGTEVLLTEPFVIAVPKDHPLSTRDLIRPRQLASEEFVSVRVGAAPYMGALSHFYAKHGLEPRIVQEASEMSTLLGLVSAGIGIAIVPRSTKSMNFPRVEFRPIKGAPTTELLLAWPGATLTGSTLAFVSAAKAALVNIENAAAQRPEHTTS